MEDPNDHNTYLGKNGVAWVLRFGGLCTLVSSRNYLYRGFISCLGKAGAAVARMVPPTKTEKEMRRRLGEMKLLKQQSSP